MTGPTLIERRQAALGAAPLFYREPLEIVRGEGAWLFDADGRRYVDMYNNVPCVGHANPRVVEAIARQQATLNVHSRYLHDGIVTLAERLVALHGPRIERVVFSCSGTEANEVALRMARLATGRRGIVCSDGTYHGNSEAVGALTRLRGRATLPPDVQAFPFPERFRPLLPGASDADLVEAGLEHLDAAITALERSGSGLAGLIVCPLFANEGLPDVPAGFMARAAERVRAAGGVVIADEVQAGYCRSGRWWGYQVAGFEPDIVVTGKPMGNGVPLAATAASGTLVDAFRTATRHFNTFASSPLQAAAGNAVLDEIAARDLQQHAATVGADLLAALRARAPRDPRIGEVRGCGLFIGIEMVRPGPGREPDAVHAAAACERLKADGFLTSHAGIFGNVVKIRPPLVFAATDAADFLAAFDRMLAAGSG